ncbi:DUF4303 domain-containing protein [Flavobacterium sp. '19STA2R22 D10 B1']|uniref:DUF4303 domain-containing protein n=1 Tax=Flavobacterium aerium TaxID=3037261 RepID=UPI00278C0829|nr:DUF4303 domain-containing protein [Flavobacterium sp. '19STA2R22 D10 B1']
MNWKEFEEKYNFENIVFELTSQSLDCIAQSEDYKKKVFGAFAFNCVSGNISLSFDTSTGINLRKEEYYPPDWTNELMEEDIDQIAELWDNQYDTIQTAFEQAMDTEDYDFMDEFEAGYLNSLRKVMVRLENSNAFDKIKTQERFWTLVTQVDADTDEEEELLEKVRQEFKA